jgi:hypothetical protein
VVGVLEEDRVVGAAADVEAAVVAGVDERPGLLLLLGLAGDELDDVLPPDLMTPAKASKPRMKETGPEASPPPESISREERILERLEPAPEPYLKSMPSVWASLRMESIESATALMKQAEHCGCSSTPTLNQTGELKLIFCR